VLADNPAWISDSDAETIWMSRIDMNIPNTMMRNAISLRVLIVSVAGTGGAPSMVGDAVLDAIGYP
jgi:hypothetical protein